MKPSCASDHPSERAAPHCSPRKDSSLKDICPNFVRPTPLFLCSLSVAAVFTFFVLYSPPNPFNLSSNHPTLTLNKNNAAIPNDEYCDLFTGRWVRDPRGSRYTSASCGTIPSSKNCFENGRRDSDFVNWRWKPHGCELPRFDPKAFLQMVSGKGLGFIGDSVARNHMESLLCLLSQEELPTDVYTDPEDRFRTWYFPRHNFTLAILWSKFLVVGEERLINGSNSGVFDLYIDRVDPKWTPQLPSLNYAIISDAHWFNRKMYLHSGTALLGCVYCNEPNVTNLGIGFALRMAFRAALSHINGCEECTGMVTVLRTLSPAHFENGTWNSGGRCQRTDPFEEEEVKLGGVDWELRGIQIEEMVRAKSEGKKKGKRFEMLDLTRAMAMRPDGHPGAYWGNKWMKGYNDCVHWCMPGPIDSWNDFLMAVLGREESLVLD